MGQGTKRFAMARAGRVAWWGREDFALLTGDCSPAPSDERGAPLRGVSFPSACQSCPARLADGRVTDEADGGVQMGEVGRMQIGRCRWGAWGKMLMGQMGDADGGMQVGGCRWGQMLMGQMQKASGRPSTEVQGKEERLHGSPPCHFLENSPRPLFSCCVFFNIACLGFGASKAHPKRPQVQVIMLSGDSHELSPHVSPLEGMERLLRGAGCLA